MDDRRKFKGPERRGRAGKVFQTAEEILKKKKETLSKLSGYELDEGVPSKRLISFIVITIFIAIAGLFRENMVLLSMCLAAAIVTAGIGMALTKEAKKKARERFKKDNLHLAKYLPS